MNANDLIADLELEPSWTGEERTILLRALRLLAAAEGGEGTPETDALHHRLVKASEGPQWIAGKDYCDMKDHARTLEQRCAALAARVVELERVEEYAVHLTCEVVRAISDDSLCGREIDEILSNALAEQPAGFSAARSKP